ncbi:MAG: hypothetical protein JZU47_13780 [Prolixibacteraceae bacterium]|nr:hypothetical protein [Prolixibacteraceae bacterium]
MIISLCPFILKVFLVPDLAYADIPRNPWVNFNNFVGDLFYLIKNLLFILRANIGGIDFFCIRNGIYTLVIFV